MADVTRRSAMQSAAVAGVAALTGKFAFAEEGAPAEEPKDMWRAWSTTRVLSWGVGLPT